MIETPELDRMSDVRDHSQAIGEFLEWLRDQGVQMVRWETRRPESLCSGDALFREFAELDAELRSAQSETPRPSDVHPPKCKCKGTGIVYGTERDELVSVDRSIERWLADYYDIDLDRVEAERRAILEELRARQ